MKAIFDEDLKEIWDRNQLELGYLKGKTLLLTGSTGTFGVWILALLSYAKALGVETKELYVVSRDPKKFIQRHPNLCNGLNISWIKGDIRDFKFPSKRVDMCIHGATTTAQETYLGIPNKEKLLTVVQGTERVLKCVELLDIETFLYLSSGAVFGGNLEVTNFNLEELYVPRIDHLNTLYTLGHAKRCAETLCFLAREQNSERVLNIARLFTFVGPHIPFNLHYAIGNFIGAAHSGLPIHLSSDGSAIRSYLYMGDAITWIFRCLFLGRNEPHALHIGSEKAYPVLDVAHLVASRFKSKVIVAPQVETVSSPAPNYYVPSTERTRKLLKVEEWTTLENSIERTFRWLA